MKEYKGKKVSYKNFIEEDVIGQTKFIYEYEGEIDYDQPHGKGTMTFEDGSKRFAIWNQGETDWD